MNTLQESTNQVILPISLVDSNPDIQTSSIDELQERKEMSIDDPRVSRYKSLRTPLDTNEESSMNFASIDLNSVELISGFEPLSIEEIQLLQKLQDNMTNGKRREHRYRSTRVSPLDTKVKSSVDPELIGFDGGTPADPIKYGVTGVSRGTIGVSHVDPIKKPQKGNFQTKIDDTKEIPSLPSNNYREPIVVSQVGMNNPYVGPTLTKRFRDTCWENNEIPRIIIDFSPDGSSSKNEILITSRPMTNEEFQNYRNCKKPFFDIGKETRLKGQMTVLANKYERNFMTHY